MATAAQGFTHSGHEVRSIGPSLSHPGGKGSGEQGRLDAGHQNSQPAPAREAVCVRLVLTERVKMRLASIGDGIVVIAIRDRTAEYHQQHLTQRM